MINTPVRWIMRVIPWMIPSRWGWLILTKWDSYQSCSTIEWDTRWYGGWCEHVAYQVSGWKSLMDKHSRVLVLNRPDGVHIIIDGGLNGYDAGNISLPWYLPPIAIHHTTKHGEPFGWRMDKVKVVTGYQHMVYQVVPTRNNAIQGYQLHWVQLQYLQAHLAVIEQTLCAIASIIAI